MQKRRTNVASKVGASSSTLTLTSSVCPGATLMRSVYARIDFNGLVPAGRHRRAFPALAEIFATEVLPAPPEDGPLGVLDIAIDAIVDKANRRRRRDFGDPPCLVRAYRYDDKVVAASGAANGLDEVDEFRWMRAARRLPVLCD